MKLHRKAKKMATGGRADAGRASRWLLLAFVAVFLVPLPAAAQVVLEREPAAVRLWSSKGGSVSVPISPGYRPRVAIAAEGGYLVAGVDEASGDLFVLHHESGSTTELPLPASRTAERAWPVLLETAGRLDGAIWLEGPSHDDFAIHAAVWNGTSFEDVEIVSVSRGLPQLAVAGTVLADGSWLVLWAGYDGEDDEVYWSRRTHGAWSAPQRLHGDNRVPDILPAVIAQGDGARAAWSYFDGNDYRVTTARLDGGRWSVGGPLEGLGAIKAGWHREGSRVFVTYHSVVPEAWSLVELDRQGVPLQKSILAGESTRRPLVTAPEGAEPRLVFPRMAAGQER